LNIKKIARITAASILFSDSLSQMYYACKPREIIKGESDRLKDHYLSKVQDIVKANDAGGVFAFLEEAVKSFNAVEVHDRKIPRIGIVGEIYIKYNSYGQLNIVNWLMEQGVEVIVPPLTDFFTQAFVNRNANKDLHIESNTIISDIISYFVQGLTNKYIERTKKIHSHFKLADHSHKTIFENAEAASKIISLANQYGEGWLIPAEIHNFAEKGVNHVISLQPFGCIANHIVSKGIEKKVKSLFPNMNLLFLDFDSGIGEVNILNRLHFMISNITEKESLKVTDSVEVL
jgi:predicted nucleotide-binding protein (sugar kinase/HSP70/actin superfamily)